ncbi:MAG: FtsX-like permease family protein [Planctomycetes bacterium]|nr:FtsX-like permease family protein [Planctomycetota bacterium]
MRLLSFLVWKSWASSPLRVVLTLLGVSLGVAVVTAIHVLDHNTILSQIERARQDYGRVDFELRPTSNIPSIEERLTSLEERDEIEKAAVFASSPVEVLSGEGKRHLISLYGQTPTGGARFGHWRVAEGRDLAATDADDAVLVAPRLAELLGIGVGAELVLSALPRTTQTRCVDGQRKATGGEVALPRRRTLRVQGILEPVRLARRDGGLVVVGRFGLVRELAAYLQPIFQIKRRDGVDPDALAATFREDWARIDERAAMFGENADEAAFRNGVKILGCLALVLGMFVIFHTLSHALAEKIRRVGILRALGATQTQVTSVFLVDAAVLAVIGTLIGLALGVGLARVLADEKITTLGLGKAVTTFEMPWTSLVTIFVLGTSVTLLGAAFPLVKVRTLSPRRILYVRDLAPPSDLMRGVNLFLLVLLVIALPLAYLVMTPLLTEAGRGAGVVLAQAIGVVAVFFAILLLSPHLVRVLGSLPLVAVRRFAPLAAWLVHKNLLRSPGRIATSVCGITLVGLAILGLRGLTSSLVAEVDAFAGVALRNKLFVKAEHQVPESRWQRLGTLPGVRSVLPLSATVMMPFRCIGTDVKALSAKGAVLDGRDDLAEAMVETRGLVISTRLARLFGLGVGAVVKATTDGGSVDYTVLAVSDTSGFFPDERAWALTHRGWLRKDFCLDVAACARFSLRLDPDADVEAVASAVRSMIPGVVWTKTGAWVQEFHRMDVGRDFRFFDILLWLLLLLAGVGQVNLITLSTIARVREIGVLRALGMTRRDWVVTLLVEALVIGFLTAILTTLAGLVLVVVLVRGLVVVSGLEAPLVVPWGALAFVVVLGFAVSFAAAIVPALRATAIAPAKSLRGSE